jgi:hypothetical protein
MSKTWTRKEFDPPFDVSKRGSSNDEKVKRMRLRENEEAGHRRQAVLFNAIYPQPSHPLSPIRPRHSSKFHFFSLLTGRRFLKKCLTIALPRDINWFSN